MDVRVFLNSFLSALSQACNNNNDADERDISPLEDLICIADGLISESRINSFSFNGVDYSITDDQIPLVSQIFLSPSHAYYRRFISLLLEGDMDTSDMVKFFIDGNVSYLALPFLTGGTIDDTRKNLMLCFFRNNNWLIDTLKALKQHYDSYTQPMHAPMMETWSDLVSIIVNVPNYIGLTNEKQKDSDFRSDLYFKGLAKQILRGIRDFSDKPSLEMLASLLQKMLRTGNYTSFVELLFEKIRNEKANHLRTVLCHLGRLEKEKLLFELLDRATTFKEVDVLSLSCVLETLFNMFDVESLKTFIVNLLNPTSRRSFLNKPDGVILALVHTLSTRCERRLFIELFKNSFGIFNSPVSTRMPPTNHLFLCKSLAVLIGYLADSPDLPTKQPLCIDFNDIFQMSELFAAAQSHLGCGTNSIRECGLAIIDLFVASFTCVQVPNAGSTGRKVIFGRKDNSESNYIWNIWERAVEMRADIFQNDEQFWRKFENVTLLKDSDSDEETADEDVEEPFFSTSRPKAYDPSLPPKKQAPKVFFLRECLKLLKTSPDSDDYREKVFTSLKRIPEFISSLEQSSIVSSKEAEETSPELLRLIRNISPWNEEIRNKQLDACVSIVQLAPENGSATLIQWVWQDLRNTTTGKTSGWIVGTESRLALEALARAAETFSTKPAIETPTMISTATKPIEFADLRISKTRYFSATPRRQVLMPRKNPYHTVFAKWYFALTEEISLLYQQKWTDAIQLEFIRFFITILVRLIYAAGPFHACLSNAVDNLAKLIKWVGDCYLFDANDSCDARVLVHPILLAFRMILSFSNENNAGLPWKMTLLPTVLTNNLNSEQWLQWLIERATCYEDDESHIAASIVQIIQQHRSDMLQV